MSETPLHESAGEWQDDITCPFCGYVDRAPWEYGFSGDDSIDTECGSCDREFRVEQMVSYSYKAEAIDNARN